MIAVRFTAARLGTGEDNRLTDWRMQALTLLFG